LGGKRGGKVKKISKHFSKQFKKKRVATQEVQPDKNRIKKKGSQLTAKARNKNTKKARRFAQEKKDGP